MFSFVGQLLFVVLLTGVSAQSTLPNEASNLTTVPLLDTSFSSAPSNKPSRNCSANEVLVDLKCIDSDLRDTNSSLAQLFLVSALSVLWVIYITYFNSRLIGLILTKILNQFVKDGYMKLGSFSFSVLSGKVMFRDVQYITPDLSIRIYDGYFIFRWWRPYKLSPWRKNKDLNEGHTRLSVVLSGLEYHVYNRSDVYAKLEELFGINSNTFTTKSKPAKSSTPKKSDGKNSQKIAWWRNLFPVIKISVSYGKIIFGNKLLPSTFVAAFEDASARYKTTKASNKFDLFMHLLEGELGYLRLMLVKSLKYDPTVLLTNHKVYPNDTPPRMMSEGLDLIHSNDVAFTYKWDESGKTGIPLEQSKFTEYQPKSGDSGMDDDNTVWALEVRCKKRVSINYGPWADRQINLLWKFFYPCDYQKQQVTPASKHGETRSAPCFNMSINLLHDSEIDLLFLKNDEPSAIHVSIKRGSCVTMDVPMIVNKDGFTTHISGQLIYPDATTSMSFRPLVSAEMLSFDVTANYPMEWNSQQMWICDIKASKASASLVFQHKNFIADFMDDWSNNDPPDLLSFNPYKMKLNFDLQDFELLLPANEHNWVDCATKRKENALVGLTGKSLKIDFTLPFHSFISPTYTIPFSFHVVRAELCLFIPESNSSRNLLLNLRDGLEGWNTEESLPKESVRLSDSGAPNDSARSSAEIQHEIGNKSNSYVHSHRLRKNLKWGFINSEWVKCWDAPEMELAISYMWHPILPTKQNKFSKSKDADLNKEMEKVDKLLQRQSTTKSSKKLFNKKSISVTESVVSGDAAPLLQDVADTSANTRRQTLSVMFDPTSLDPDEICVNFTLKPGSTLYLYGSLLHHFLAIKENYLGTDDVCTDFNCGPSQQTGTEVLPEQSNDPLYYRTLQVTVNVNLHKIRGILPVHRNSVFKCCPIVKLKRLTFEMDKNYHQTRLQLLLSKLAITVEENPLANDFGDQTEIGRKGWLTLLDLQLRGHAMFSGSGLPRGSVTIEYGWLTEVLVGPVIGKLSIPQIQMMLEWVQSFLFLFENSTHEMKPAFPNRFLPTGINWNDTKQDGKPIAEEDVKFLMLHVKLESVKVRIEEKDSVLDLCVSPVLISNGNIQQSGTKEAAEISVHQVLVKHFIKKIPNIEDSKDQDNVTWVEAGEVKFGSLHASIKVATAEKEMFARQLRFLRFHDKKTRRLSFLGQDGPIDEPDASENSVMKSVKLLKSWGCSFFTPMTSKHPTYFYYKSENSAMKKQASLHDGRRMRTFYQDNDSGSSSSESEDKNSSDKDSDVFDSGMDYGMSLLKEGKCLLSRSRTLSNFSKKSSTSVESAQCEGEDNDPITHSTKQNSAGEVLISTDNNETESPKKYQKLRPSLKRQGKINSSTGNMSVLAAMKSPNTQLTSVFRRNRSATVDSSMESSAAVTQQVSFAPSPEKRSVLRKSVSQTDIDKELDVAKQSMKRALSSESNLYKSAESDFKSTTSLSSNNTEEFYSAESDVNESKRNSIESSLSTPTKPITPLFTNQTVPEIAPRPGTLLLESEHNGGFSASTSNDTNTSTAKSPDVMKTFSNSPASEYSPRSNHRSKSFIESNTTILACYESHLTLLKMLPARRKSRVAGIVIIEEEDDDWYDEDSFLLPDFTTIRDGIHPSVIIDREVIDVERNGKYHHDNKPESANKQSSPDKSDSSGKSTTVSVHLKESLDVQLTPFLLDTVGKVLDAATNVFKNQNPISIISKLEVDCLDDAVEQVPEDIENDVSGKETADTKEKKKPSLKRQKRTEVNLDDETKSSSSSPTVTRPPPGTKLSVKMDKVRVNILQATLGDDKIFSLRCSKLLPTPCVTVLATRLDSLVISVDMNSRRKNRLMMENLRKFSRTSTSTNLKPSGNESRLQKMSTSSDLGNNKHFLVLLNAEATASSVAMQMRAMTCDGSVPSMTSITALSDKVCKAPFNFDPKAALPNVKESLEKWKIDRENTPESPGGSKIKRSRYPTGPPKLCGWVMMEAGIDNVKVNVIKQRLVNGMKDTTSLRENDNLSDVEERLPGEDSLHVHFVDESLRSLDEKQKEWLVQETSLHASQGELSIGSVWLNVPSPSAENVTRTRAFRSWNLLSCVSASITCWLDPADRMITALTRLSNEKLTRHCAVTACILTEAFHSVTSGGEPFKPMEPAMHKYDVLTAQARYLRKDANFLLCNELQRFLRSEEARQIVFAAVGSSAEGKANTLPALVTLKKGVAALLRQWTSQYSGAFSYRRLNSMSKKTNEQLLPNREDFDGVNEEDGNLTGVVEYHHPSLVIEADIPGEDSGTQEQFFDAENQPRSMSRPPFSKSNTFTSLSAIEEGMIASGSGLGGDSDTKGLVQTDGPQNGENIARTNAKTPPNMRMSHMTPAEELVYNQQQSLYSWMSNAAKSNSPTQGSRVARTITDDIESQAAILNDVFGDEKSDDKQLWETTQTLENTTEVDAPNHALTMQIASFEEVFETFLHNVGIDLDVPSTQKTSTNESFIQGECLGSLSLNMSLELLEVDKQEVDASYNLDILSRRKKKSMKTRKPKSFYSSLEHAREMREPYIMDTRTWPHVYSSQQNTGVKKSPPILICKKIELRSSIVEGDTEVKEGSRNSGSPDKSSPKTTAQKQFTKNKSTLRIGAQLSLDDIVQHVDVALVRLIYQIVQIQDNVKQAKTDILVNKYTQGSTSPDFKIMHRRTDSNVSSGSNNVALPFTSRQTSSVSRDSIPSTIHDVDDNISNDSVSTASVEIPHCWQLMYKMVDLYQTVPDVKTDQLDKPVTTPQDAMHVESELNNVGSDLSSRSGSVLRRPTFSLPYHDPYISLVLKATAEVKKIEMHAAVGDLKLNAIIQHISTKVDHSKEIRTHRVKASSRFITTLNGVEISLVDHSSDISHSKKNICTVCIHHSSLDASTNHERLSADNVCQLNLGLISFDLPQHPAALHNVVSRSSRQVTAHISEFSRTPTLKMSYNFDHPDSATPFLPTTPGPSSTTVPMTPVTPSALIAIIDMSQDSTSLDTSTPVTARFVLESEGVSIEASLLPSLNAQYKTGHITGEGTTGLNAIFSFLLPSHSLQFTTKSIEHSSVAAATTEINLPEVEISGRYKQCDDEELMERGDSFSQQSEGMSSDLQLRSGDYLSVNVRIGSFTHSLTTDLLNQLMFLQEVFLKEINEMVEKVSQNSKPFSLWSETSVRSVDSSTISKPMLYQLELTLEGIQITAATPSHNAIRLKTGEMTFELSNRVVQNKGPKKKKKKKGLNVPKYLRPFGKAQVDLTLSLGTLIRNTVYPETEDEFQQLAYFTTRIGLQNTRQAKAETSDSMNGQARGSASTTVFSSTMDGTPLYDNPSTHSIDDRLLHPQISEQSDKSDNSIVLISLKRPLIFVQPTAFDKAILIYLAYKNAYEDWKEQQQNVRKTAKQVKDVIQSSRMKSTIPMSHQSHSQQSYPQQQHHTSTVFLQLSVDDLGVCLPMSETVQLHEISEQGELSSALVLTIDKTIISANYSKSLTTKGQLKGFCLRFTDDFQTSWDDWRHNIEGSTRDMSSNTNQIPNALVVPEGTYEICSDTTTSNPTVAKTTVSFLWKMKGMDAHFDTKIGAYFSQLTDTLMAITGQDEPNFDDDLDIQLSDDDTVDQGNAVNGGSEFSQPRVRSYTAASSLSSHALPFHKHKERERRIEQKLNRQAKIVTDFRQLNAKQSFLDEEERKLHELESALSSNFRQVVRSRLRRSSTKTGNRKEPPPIVRKLRASSHQRTKSASIGDTGTELPPRSSSSAYSTLPMQHEFGQNTARDAYSLSQMSSRSSRPSGASVTPVNPSPLTYDADHVFSQTPDKNYGLRSGQHSDLSEEDFSDMDEVDGVPHVIPRTAPAASDLTSVRRSLYQPKQENIVKTEYYTNTTQMASTPEADLQLELDIRVEVDGGRLECHPHLQEIDVTVKPDYGMMPSTYGNPKTRNFVKNTTVFYIPGLDIRVHYNSASSAVTSMNVKEKVFSFDSKEKQTTEENIGSPDTPEYSTPPPDTVLSQSSENNSKLKMDAKVVPNIEVTTPSKFSKKPDNVFVLPTPTQTNEVKRACVHAWVSLQPLPEMVISPYLLDFVEQTLNEIAIDKTPMQSFSQKHSGSSSRQGSTHESLVYTDEEASDIEISEANDDQTAGDGSVLSSESPLVSLPLDVVVAVNVQPSQVRFNCVPMSRVECLLQIPSMDLAFSSIQDDTDFSSNDAQDTASKKAKQTKESKSEQDYSAETTTAGNQSPKGVSFSAVLSNFSVYVFHPYGGKQPAGNAFPLDMTSSFMGSPAAGATTDSPFSKSGSGRRDSLNVNLEFVKINLVRRKKGENVFVADIFSPGSVKGRVDNVTVHVSGLLDIGKASFKYDMRRLNEILAFPRAWYRRSIARRMFLGDTSEQTHTSNSPQPKPKTSKQDVRPNTKVVNPARSRAHTAPVGNSVLSFLTDSPLSPQQRPLTSKGSKQKSMSPNVANNSSPISEGGQLGSGSIGPSGPVSWQALVVLKMNMSRLDVEMNMSNVMGNTVWSCDALKSQGRLMFHSNGDRDITLSCGLDNSQINARGGIIGGQLELKKFDADCRLLDPADGDPNHQLNMRAQSLDGRIEYMGGCIMMGQLTNADFKLSDEWRDPVQSIPSNMDKGTVYVHCDLGWRVFQLSISRSTTPDVIKMLSKLKEFFSQQLHSSVRAISTWTQGNTRPPSPRRVRAPISAQSSVQESALYDHRRHWPPVFKAVAAALVDSTGFGSRKQLQDRGFLLGGSACLHGEGLVVVCFHGTNFRSRSWVLFNILQPNIVFSTEVQEIKETISGDECSTLAIQSLTVNLGHDVWLSRTMKAADPMATVSRVTRSRNQNPPPGSASIPEWFSYMTASHNEELKMLRTLNVIGEAKSGTSAAASSNTASPILGNQNDSTGSMTYSHEADIIFALPKVQLDFKTEHMQGPMEPDPQDTDNKPMVECSFVTEFTDHICVTMDVELILFLHDLISSYLKEKQQALSSRTKLSSLTVNVHNDNMDGSFTNDANIPKPLPIDPIDLRTFVCINWQLEPTVRLISWAGRRIEPVGVDYILQKLGFQHARTTIPKWFQRGVLDLLDKGLAAIVEKLVVTILNQQKKND